MRMQIESIKNECPKDVNTKTGMNTHTLLDLVSDCLQDSGTVALTQLLRGPQVVAGRLHLLLLKRHHGVLQHSPAAGAEYNHRFLILTVKLSAFTHQSHARADSLTRASCN